MVTVIGQRWEVYQYEPAKNLKPRKGEVVLVKGAPGFGEMAIFLVSNDGERTIEDLFEKWKYEGEGTLYVPKSFFIEHGHTGGKYVSKNGIEHEDAPQITADGLAANSVITAKILNKNVTFAKIADVTADTTGAEAVFSAAAEAFSAFLKKVWQGITWLNAQVKLKAPIASPSFTGTPKVPNKTSAATSDGTLIATEAQVSGALSTAKSYTDSASTAINNIIKNHVGIPEWNDENYTLKFTSHDGQTLLIDFPIESLAKDMRYDAAAKELVLIKEDGAEIRVDVSDLIGIYSGSVGAHIQITVESGNVITASLLNGSIDETELSVALLAKINSKAEQTALETETAAREAADEELAAALSTETAAREAADESLVAAIEQHTDDPTAHGIDSALSDIAYAIAGIKTELNDKSDVGHTHSVEAGTTDLTAGSSPLATGQIYLVYE